MNFSKEMIEKAKTASSAEELIEMAKKEGVELSTADAEMYFSFLKGSQPLSDEELEAVAGGKGQKEMFCKYCLRVTPQTYVKEDKGWDTDGRPHYRCALWLCPVCNCTNYYDIESGKLL